MNLKMRTLLIGGVVGAAVGVLGGLLYYNSASIDEGGEVNLPQPKASELMQVGLGVLGVLRMLTG